MSSNLNIRFIHPNANGRGREPLEEVLAHGSKKLAFACAFMTDAGYKIITPYLHYINKPGSFGVISIQQPTSYKALKNMFESYPNNTYVHLGTIFQYYEKANSSGLMHSKLFLANDGKTTKVFCGSHNLTGSALQGLNMEAATLIEGPSDHQFFKEVEVHLEDCKSKSSKSLPKREGSESRIIIEIEVDDPLEFISKITRGLFIKFLPQGTKDQPKLTPTYKFTILLFKKGMLKPDQPSPLADAYINGTTTALNLGKRNPLQGVDASFSDIHYTITESTPGIFEINQGNLGAEDALSAVFKTTVSDAGSYIYLIEKPNSEDEVLQVTNAINVKLDKKFKNSTDYEIRRTPEPKIDEDIKEYFKETPSVIDSLLSRKRYWISRWKRNIRD
jgi:hypothetical protein